MNIITLPWKLNRPFYALTLYSEKCIITGRSTYKLKIFSGTIDTEKGAMPVPCGRKRKRHKIATHKRKKKLRKNRHKKK